MKIICTVLSLKDHNLKSIKWQKKVQIINILDVKHFFSTAVKVTLYDLMALNTFLRQSIFYELKRGKKMEIWVNLITI